MPDTTTTLAQSLSKTANGFGRATQSTLGLPFDLTRELYAKAAQVGLIQSSMLASRDVERVLNAMEKVTLGPWARRI